MSRPVISQSLVAPKDGGRMTAQRERTTYLVRISERVKSGARDLFE